LGGAVLGLVHCISWTSQFPTTAESIMWRIAASAIAVSPALICFWFVFGQFLDNLMTTDTIWEWPKYLVIGIPVIFTVMVYVAARYYLIVEAFLVLRALPPSALQTVQWSNFLPHI
ncbi:hypothetical protein BDQ17DRAFT_1211969, partial [Cyathus striatus]